MLVIAIFAWVVRSMVESYPDRFLLNLTLFAFAGQCILTAGLARAGNAIVFPLLIVGVVLLVLQILIIRAQQKVTLQHYEKLLSINRFHNVTNDEIESWAAVLLQITGADFHPEVYKWSGDIGLRWEKRSQAISILPKNHFDCGESGVTAHALIVPPEYRRALWRLYVGVCFLSFAVFIVCILIATRHQ